MPVTCRRPGASSTEGIGTAVPWRLPAAARRSTSSDARTAPSSLGAGRPAVGRRRHPHPAVGIARRVDPDEPRPAGHSAGSSAATGVRHQGRRPRRWVRRARVHDDVARPESEQQRQQGDELLRADRRRTWCRGQAWCAARRVPAHDGLAERGRAHGLRVGVGVGRRGEGVRDERAWDRRASRSRQIDDAAVGAARARSAYGATASHG